LVACGSISSGLLHASDRRYGTIEDGQKVGISPSPTPSDPVITLSRFCAARSTLIMLNARALSPLSVGRSKFKAFVKRRLRTRPRRWAHFEDSPATQCPRCDKGQHRASIKLKHCTAKDRSPPGTGNKREKCARDTRPYGCGACHLRGPLLHRPRALSHARRCASHERATSQPTVALLFSTNC